MCHLTTGHFDGFIILSCDWYFCGFPKRGRTIQQKGSVNYLKVPMRDYLWQTGWSRLLADFLIMNKWPFLFYDGKKGGVVCLQHSPFSIVWWLGFRFLWQSLSLSLVIMILSFPSLVCLHISQNSSTLKWFASNIPPPRACSHATGVAGVDFARLLSSVVTPTTQVKLATP